MADRLTEAMLKQQQAIAGMSQPRPFWGGGWLPSQDSQVAEVGRQFLKYPAMIATRAPMASGLAPQDFAIASRMGAPEAPSITPLPSALQRQPFQNATMRGFTNAPKPAEAANAADNAIEGQNNHFTDWALQFLRDHEREMELKLMARNAKPDLTLIPGGKLPPEGQ